MQHLPLYEIVVWFVVGLAVLVLLLLAVLVIERILAFWIARRRRRRELVLLPLVCRALTQAESSSELVAAVRKSDQDVVLQILLCLAVDLRGRDGAAIEQLARETGVVDRELRRFSRGAPRARGTAAKNLGMLRVGEAIPAINRCLREDHDDRVRLAAVWALGEIGGQGAVLGLLAMLEDPSPGMVLRVQETLLQTACDAASEVATYVRMSSVPAARRAAVAVLGALRDPEATELLLELTRDPDPELRIGAAKAAASIADPRLLEALHSMLSDSRWEVRCQGAKGLGALGSGDSVPTLRSALADAAWWVRFNAATALAEIGEPGVEALRDASSAGCERTREVARYVLERSVEADGAE